MRLNVNVKYFEKQLEIINSVENDSQKYYIITKGRRFGLTRGLMQFAYEKMLEGNNILWGDTIHANLVKYIERYMLPMFRNNKIGYNWNKSLNTFKINRGGYMDLRSAENPENWEGFGYDFIILNEAGIILQNKSLYTVSVLPMLLDNPNSKLIAGGVPKGRKDKTGKEHMFFTLHKKSLTKPEKYKSFKYSSYDNPLLSETDINELAEEMTEMDSEMVQQEIYGEFVNSKSGLVYEYKPELNTTDRTITEKDILHIGMDFNITNMNAVVHIVDKGVMYAVDEFTEVYDTNSMIERIKERYPKQYIYIYPDASGQNRNTSGKTDVQLLQQAGLKVKALSKNPFVRDRVNEVNKQLRSGNYLINPKTCPKYIEALEQIGWKGGEPDKTSGYDHETEAGGYFIWAQRVSNFSIKV